MPNYVETTIRVQGTADTVHRLLRFLAFFHFNGGHTGLFAMPFDGDGHERLKVLGVLTEKGEESMPEDFRKGVHAIARAGASPEVAQDGCYTSRSNRAKTRYTAYDDGRLEREEG